MKKINYYLIYKLLVIIFTIFTILFTLIAEKERGFEYIYLIPIIYILLFFSNNQLHKYSKKYNGMLILNFIMFIRYSIAIFCMVYGDDYLSLYYSGRTPKPESCSQAILYMIVEMIFIFVTIMLFSDKIYGKQNNTVNEFSKISINIPLFFFLLFSSCLAMVFYRKIIPRQILFINSDYSSTKEEMSGFFEIVFLSLKTILMGGLINNFWIKYQTTNKKKYILYVYAVLFITIMLNTSTSRINMILPFFLFIIIMMKKFSKKEVLLLIPVGILLVLSIVSITIYKSEWMFDNTNKNTIGAARVFMRQIQEYTSGIRPIAQGIETVEEYRESITVDTFINDIFGSIPSINKLFNKQNRINRYYNKYIFGDISKKTSMIMPMVTISMAYFTPIFLWVITVFNMVLLMILDSNFSKINNYLVAYINSYAVFILATSIFSNTQMIIGRFFTRYIPVVLILYFNKKIIIKSHKKNEKTNSERVENEKQKSNLQYNN